MSTKRFPIQASTLCAGGTLLVLGGFLALNLAGCGGGGSGGVITPTAIPGVTPQPSPATLSFQLQLSDGTNATGGSVRLFNATGRNYPATANRSGFARVGGVVPGIYTLLFTVPQPDGSSKTTTRSITVSSGSSSVGTQSFTLRSGDTGNSNPFTITGRIIFNDAITSTGTPVSTPTGTPTAPPLNCSSSSTPITDAVLVTVRDLNSTNGTPIIAQVVRPAQPTSTSGTQKGLYSISIPYQPTSFVVTVSQATTDGQQFAGISANTSFPLSATTVPNVDVCTNTSTTPPQPVVTDTPTSTPFATATTIGTPIGTATSTPINVATATPTSTTAAATATPTSTTSPVATATP